MHRTVAAALALAFLFVASAAAAQTTVIVVEPTPPPPVVVVIEPPPPPVVSVTIETPAPSPSSLGGHPRFVLDLRGDLLMGAGYDAALGGSALGGVAFDNGLGVQLAVGYASEMIWGGSEVNLGIELQRDFSPHDTAGFVLLGRVGTAFLLDDALPRDDAGVRLSGQLGIGGRFDLSSDLAFTMDLRAVLRFRPDDPFGPNERDVSAGALFTIGLRIRM